MIGQYLPNNNKKSYNTVLQKKIYLNRPLVEGGRDHRISGAGSTVEYNNCGAIQKVFTKNYNNESCDTCIEH
jgi:hypothetical protein